MTMTTKAEDERKNTVHAGTLIRLQVTTNCLQMASHIVSQAAFDLQRPDRLDPTDFAEMQQKLAELAPLISAALQIAWGGQTTIPEKLVMNSAILNEDRREQAERFLQQSV